MISQRTRRTKIIDAGKILGIAEKIRPRGSGKSILGGEHGILPIELLGDEFDFSSH